MQMVEDFYGGLLWTQWLPLQSCRCDPEKRRNGGPGCRFGGLLLLLPVAGLCVVPKVTRHGFVRRAALLAQAVWILRPSLCSDTEGFLCGMTILLVKYRPQRCIYTTVHSG